MKRNRKRGPAKAPARPAAEPPRPEPTPDYSVPPPPPEPLLTRLDWSAFWAACGATLIVYVWTLAPTLTLEDSGELATASYYFGVPHPPGYPIWTIITGIFTRIFGFVRYHGQPNPAWSVGLASAVFGALASGITSMLICRSGRDVLRGMKATTDVIGVRTEGLICWAAGIACSLVFAFDPIVWSQSVIAEVYSLNAFFLVLVMLLAYLWIRHPQRRYLLYWTAFVFGLGMTNYQVLLLLGLSLAVIVMVKDLELLRDFIIVGLPFAAVAALIKFGKLPPIVHPTHVTCCVYLSMNFLALVLAYFLLPRGREVALTILCVELGLALYGFMPIASEFNPPMNWGYPRTWEGFKHALTRGQYEKIVPTDAFSLQFIRQIGDYLSDLRGQFTLPITLLGFLPFTGWGMKLGERRFKALFVAVVIAIAASALVIAEEVLMPTNKEIPLVSAAYRLLILAIMILAAMGGAAVIINEVAEMIRRVTNRPPTPLSQKTTVCLVLCGVLVAYGYYAYRLILKLTDASLGLGGLEKLGIVFFILGPLAVAAGMVWLMFGPPRLEFEMDRAAQKWIIATLSGFLVMSIVLILLANPKGDIQDMFIQRVKFISSHALYAFWIGYGILVGLAFVDTVTRANRTVKWLGISAALLIPAIPILENAFNKELIRTVGGAEQNQHDFGWQFGNYQLRGAHAIAEELSADEEPLPNPEYPAEMGYAAVFYGGTDPGRFVPTYMIYGAKVRPDVYLITQNALADNTYMSVMRDLYGDLIWIPCIRDGNYAFQKYVEDVNAGRIPASAEIVIQNGRVSVQGVQGVMLINGILAKMIFDYNKAKHDFYVEESYVIQWMYPYLEPHGLIMKINPEPMPAVAPETVRNDMDFWDWYTRRLVNNPKFIRDVVARKSFSKLRSAIAGVYVVRNLFAEAERAFLEAVALYPLSPEANFRLADLYLRWSRPADAIRIMEDFSRHDPANDRAGQFLNDIRNREKLVARKTELESKLASGVPTEIGSAFELADIYRRLGDDQKFLGITLNILNNSNMPPAVIANIARMYAEARKFDYMEIAVQKYLAQMPSDMNAWLDLAATRIALQKTTEALKAAQQAVRVGGEAAQETLRKDKRFDPLRNIPAFRELLGKG